MRPNTDNPRGDLQISHESFGKTGATHAQRSAGRPPRLTAAALPSRRRLPPADQAASAQPRHAAHRPAILASSGLSFELRQAPPFYPACVFPAGGGDYIECDLKSYGWVHIYFCKILFLFPDFHHQAMFSA